MAKNGFYFYKKNYTNDFDKIWVKNGPQGSLQHGFNFTYPTIVLVVRKLYIYLHV